MIGSPFVGGGGGGTFASITGSIQDNAQLASMLSVQAYLTLDNMLLTGAVVKQYDQQAQDLFVDETGVTTKTNMTYDAANNRYSPTPSASATFLLQSETTDGSTTFTDTAGAKSITRNGDTQHDTAQAYFGSSSILFDGTGDYLSIADSEDWNLGSGNFTMDCRIRLANVTGFHAIIGQWPDVGQVSTTLYTNGTSLVFAYSTNGSGVAASITGGTLSANTWYHVAVVRNGNTINLYIDGTSIGSTDVTGITIFNANTSFYIGSQGAASLFSGHMEEIRFLKGTAVWTSNFTPPAAPYNLDLPNVTFVSDPFTATSAPTQADVYALVQFTTGSVSDLSIGARREGASSYASSAPTDTGFDFYDINTAETYDIVKVNDLDLSAQTSGTAPQVQLTSSNAIEFYFKGWLMQWL